MSYKEFPCRIGHLLNEAEEELTMKMKEPSDDGLSLEMVAKTSGSNYYLEFRGT